jgi:DNA-binding transcriptional LysR family regulator
MELSMDRFHELRAFIAVAEAGGFAKAAINLNSSPPAITRAVAGLEDRLGVRLFNRTTRTVHLTQPGIRFLEDARRVLSDLDTAEQDLNADSGEGGQCLRFKADSITVIADTWSRRRLEGSQVSVVASSPGLGL